jgi:short-subunit dehydrogenase
MTLLAAMLDATNILNGRDNKLKSPSYARLIPASESIDLTDIDLTSDEDLSRMSRTAQYEKDRAAINYSINCNGLGLAQIHSSTSWDSSCTVMYICSSAHLR